MSETFRELLATLSALAETYRPLFIGLGIGSFVISLLGILLVPIFVNRLPKDHFIQLAKAETISHPPLRFAILNILGATIFLAGFIMVFIPGQGLLTMFLGMLLMSFPGKRRIVLALVHRKGIAHTLNWIRKRGRRPPLEFPG